ncbi:DNA polymerase III subunit chi [Kushneria aurantia]|uniref:DNA polymerase III subunit chi n=1 Tax=Kushneria aurantia TaxID=504092 RepID=A0ABV6G1W0_9GAMM|nr:DNA polymerase III subunit chi [Kushneria aurantia]
MTRIDFYVLSATTAEARLDFACRLAETIYRKGYRLHLHCEDEAMAAGLDDRLWTFRHDAFVPHVRLDDQRLPPAPVTLGWQDAAPPPGIEALLNLHPDIPDWFSRFPRVAEIISQQQTVLSAKRACWQAYRERGYEVESHRIGGG